MQETALQNSLVVIISSNLLSVRACLFFPALFPLPPLLLSPSASPHHTPRSMTDPLSDEEDDFPDDDDVPPVDHHDDAGSYSGDDDNDEPVDPAPKWARAVLPKAIRDWIFPPSRVQKIRALARTARAGCPGFTTHIYIILFLFSFFNSRTHIPF